MKFIIKHRETLLKTFIVEAESEDEALGKFNEGVSTGRIDLGDMEIVESENTIALIPTYRTACEWK